VWAVWVSAGVLHVPWAKILTLHCCNHCDSTTGPLAPAVYRVRRRYLARVFAYIRTILLPIFSAIQLRRSELLYVPSGSCLIVVLQLVHCRTCLRPLRAMPIAQRDETIQDGPLTLCFIAFGPLLGSNQSSIGKYSTLGHLCSIFGRVSLLDKTLQFRLARCILGSPPPI
jgi:hypothetical protein